MRVLITGITGFAGSHLARWLLAQGGIEVFGVCRGLSSSQTIEDCRDRLTVLTCDLTDAASVQRALGDIQPDRVVHLAAQTEVSTSWDAPAQVMTNNVVGQIHLLEGLRALRPAPRILIAGSSEEYGLVHPDELPIRETNPLRPLSPYAVSKVAQDLLGYQYAHSFRMPLVRARAFNHTGPRQSERFVLSNFAKQIAMIEAGLKAPVLRVGNLDARRDVSDVRDIVRGYWLLLEQGEPGEVYNLCAGRENTIADLLRLLLGLTSASIRIEADPERLRVCDVPILRGDSTACERRTGWRAERSLERTLKDLLDDWRARIRVPGSAVAT
jgi:GDP-4-dehydro-6-deoxy-D-mannose reductase